MKASVTLILASSEAKDLSRKTVRRGCCFVPYTPPHRAGHIGAESGHESAVVHIVDSAAVQIGVGVGQVNLHAPVQQVGVEQIQIGAPQ